MLRNKYDPKNYLIISCMSESDDGFALLSFAAFFPVKRRKTVPTKSPYFDASIALLCNTLFDCLVRSDSGQVLGFVVLEVYGRRVLNKQAMQVQDLQGTELLVYRRIRKKFENNALKARVLDFIAERTITKRLINYFVVHFAQVHDVTYYLDKSSYPFRIVGDVSLCRHSSLRPDERNESPPSFESLTATSRENQCKLIHLYQEYKSSRSQKYKNFHAPYARSTIVEGEDGFVYSLCELNFYIWLDSVGGFDAFRACEAQIRQEKAEFDHKAGKKKRAVSE